MFDDGRGLSPSVDALRSRGLIVRSALSALPGGAGPLRRWLLPLYPRAVVDLSRRLAGAHVRQPIDLLISTSSAAVKGLRPPEGVPHLCYCHAPARYVWSRGQDYQGGLRGIGLRLFGGTFRTWDARTAANVTWFIANSTHTAREIRRCYGRDAAVVHPPVRTEFFTPDARIRRQDFWLVVSALEPYKRVDLAIEAAAIADSELMVAGSGSQRGRLESLARAHGARVTFLGRISDDHLRDLYRSARLLVFPQVEDFGIVAAEALACGLPVVARRAGGALDMIEDGVTGAFFNDPTASSLVDAASRAPSPEVCGDACRRHAMRFAEAEFDARFGEQILGILAADVA